MAGKKTTPPAEVAPDTWKKVGVWLDDHIHDIEVDAGHIASQQGRDLMPALRGLAKHLQEKGWPK